jgi:hypothetical protein
MPHPLLQFAGIPLIVIQPGQEGLAVEGGIGLLERRDQRVEKTGIEQRSFERLAHDFLLVEKQFNAECAEAAEIKQGKRERKMFSPLAAH